MKIAFIGAGKMAEAIVSGLIRSKSFSSRDIFVSDVSEERIKLFKKNYKVNALKDNQRAIDSAGVIVLSVKPQNFNEILKGLSFKNAKLVISIAAGITINYLQNNIPDKAVARAMPNNPALVGKGITAVAFGSYAVKKEMETVNKIFKTVGEVVQVSEHDMDAITALSGSGPGFIYYIVEAMIEAGENLGLTKGIAEKLAAHTILGSAEALLKTRKSASELRAMVTSPNGTTKAGLDVLGSKNFNDVLIEAITAAYKRSKELSSEACHC